MRKRLYELSAAILLILMVAGCGGNAGDSTVHTTMEGAPQLLNPTTQLLNPGLGTEYNATVRENEVKFLCVPELVNKVNFQMTDYAISDGQPFSGVTSKWDGNHYIITVKAGRHKTREVADYFKSNSKTAKILCRSAENNSPDEMNFAVKGNLTIDGHTYAMVLAQGNNTLYNNWWAGSGADFLGRPRHMISHDGRYAVQAMSNESDLFYVSIQTPSPLADWMKDIDDAKSIKDISTPGTHDSCTSNINTNDPTKYMAICQEWDLGSQCVLGVRAVDIRVKTTNSDGGRFTIFHGPYYCNRNFNDVLDDCFHFLAIHPTETIIMLIKLEGDGECPADRETILWKYINEYGREKFWTEDRIPTLGDARGKIVLVNRMDDEDSAAGIKVSFPDNTKGSTSTNRHGITFFIEDFYNTGDANEKMNAVKDSFSGLQSGAHTTPAYIYTSCTSLPIHDPYNMASQINPQIFEYFCTLHKVRWAAGWIMMDFIMGSTINEIIKTNFY